ncbi:ABC transporter permease [Chelativorans sp. YIM 93263]
MTAEAISGRTGTPSGFGAAHAARALGAIVQRDLFRFVHQRGRLVAAVVRPSLWLLVFALGFRNVFGVSIIPPYETYVEYQVYVVPGLLGMVLLFNGMQSSLAMVYDREMGFMRLLLAAPLPRWYLLLSKLVSGTVLSVLQAFGFLAVAAAFGVDIPWMGWLWALPALLLVGMMLGALGLALSVHIRQIENFAGAMNFVIFPMFFISPALYPLWRFEEAGAQIVHVAAQLNPFTYGVQLIRFTLYGQFHTLAAAVVGGCLVAFFALAVAGYRLRSPPAAPRNPQST